MTGAVHASTNSSLRMGLSLPLYPFCLRTMPGTHLVLRDAFSDSTQVECQMWRLGKSSVAPLQVQGGFLIGSAGALGHPLQGHGWGMAEAANAFKHRHKIILCRFPLSKRPWRGFPSLPLCGGPETWLCP